MCRLPSKDSYPILYKRLIILENPILCTFKKALKKVVLLKYNYGTLKYKFW